ncbi:MAG: hypothetical protein ACPKOP_04020 [Sphaerochaetaceae bacterium]
MFIKMNKSGIYVISDYLPDNGVEVTKEEYDSVMHPTLAQKRAAYLLGPASDRDKKRYLFKTLRAQLKTDGSFEEDPDKLFYQGMTVDEMQVEWAKYVGDDDQIATEILRVRKNVKDWIRGFVDTL